METVKATVLGMIYFKRDKLVRSLVTKESFSTLWQVIFQLEYFRIVWMNLVRSRKQQLFSGSLYTIHNETPIGLLKSPWKIFFIGQNLNHIHGTYSFGEILIFFWVTVVDVFCLKFDFSQHQRNIVRNYILRRKQIKQRKIPFHWSQMMMLKNSVF